MTPDDFAAALTDRLRRRGLFASPEDVRAFTADVGQRITDAPDMDQWAEWYIQARGSVVQVACRPSGGGCQGALIGLLCGPLVMVVAGAVLGAIFRPAQCYVLGEGGPNMMQGAAYGAEIFVASYWTIPMAIVTAVIGAVAGRVLAHRKDRGRAGAD